MTSPAARDHAIVVLTHFPSPYQVELFNEVERQYPGRLCVLYLHQRDASRRWAGRPVTHAHLFLDSGDAVGEASAAVTRAGFVVFNYYNEARAATLIRQRAATGRPWCFWGERPGYRFPWLARLARLRRLAPLRAANHPIWGIGEWAVSAYRDEFGASRDYFNLPYHSDLIRFQESAPQFSETGPAFLFSGSLSRRKGVDVLARSFRLLARENPRVRLTVVGEGEWLSRMKRDLVELESRVEWVGFKDMDDLPAIYASAQFLCVPSRHDGWGLVVPEGLAAGLPVVGSDRTGAALELIEPGRNGWIVRAGDPDSLLDAMRSAAALDRDAWTAMSRHARASVGHLSVATGARRFMDGVDRALGGGQVGN